MRNQEDGLTYNWIACQALGLIDKYVTGTLWRMMVKKMEVLNMSKHYQKMKTFLMIVC